MSRQHLDLLPEDKILRMMHYIVNSFFSLFVELLRISAFNNGRYDNSSNLHQRVQENSDAASEEIAVVVAIVCENQDVCLFRKCTFRVEQSKSEQSVPVDLASSILEDGVVSELLG